MHPDPAGDERPPVFGTWRRFYILVAAFLVLQVLVYWLLTRSYS
jgi:hypothetical protein